MTPLSSRMIDVGLTGVLGLSILYVWAPTLGTRFYQDDYWILFLTQNPYLGLVPGAIPWEFQWRPLGLFVPSYLMRRLFGLDPFMFHLANLFIHLVNGLMVYRLGRATVRARPFALIAAIFYSLHLAHTRHFQWIGFDSLLSATWYLFAFHFYLRFRQAGHARTYWASLIAFTAALFTKEWSVTLLPLLLCYELVGPPASDSPGPSRPWRSVGIRLMGYCVPLAAYLSLRVFLYSFSLEGGYRLTMSGGQAARWLAQYLVWTLSPSVAAGFSLDTMAADLLTATLFGGLVVSWICRWRWVTFGLAWFVLTLSPVLFISRLESRYLVIPLAGFAIAVSALSELMVHRLPFDALRRGMALLVPSVLFGAMLLSAAKDVRLQQQANWLVTVQRFVDCTLIYVSHRWPSLPPQSVLFLVDFREDEPMMLAWGSAVNVYYHDNTIRTSFLPQARIYMPFVNTTMTPSPSEEKIVRRDTLATFCRAQGLPEQ